MKDLTTVGIKGCWGSILPVHENGYLHHLDFAFEPFDKANEFFGLEPLPEDGVSYLEVSWYPNGWFPNGDISVVYSCDSKEQGHCEVSYAPSEEEEQFLLDKMTEYCEMPLETYWKNVRAHEERDY